MAKFSAYAVATALGVLASITDAAQDSNHYPGFTNPNLSDELYYADAVNVIQDLYLGKFESLYIKYKSCVWSEYGTGAENNQDNQNDDGGGSVSANCGSGNGGDEHWYMGRTACFRANAAFELYGVLSGSSTSGCRKGTFINSFFTRLGPEVVGDAFGIDSSVVNAMCTSNAAADDAAGDDGWGNNEDSHNVLANSGETSYGTGCSSQGKFRIDTFEGSYCDGLHYQATTSSPSDLSDYNSAMEALECTKIYDASNGTDLATGILTYSQACSITEFPGVCADPYGKIASRSQALSNAAKRAHNQALKQATYTPIKTSSSKSMGAKIMDGISAVMLLIGLFLFASTFFGSRKINSPTEQIESEPETNLPMIREISRTVSEVSQQVVDKLQTYAEEEEPVVDYGIEDEPQSTPATAPVASATAPVELDDKPKMKKKRPRLAKLSKKFFGSKKK